jgi:AcrR family transcriptional regulator
MAAATRVIVTHGLSAPTAMIAQEAGVSNGSLFTYFETKADMFNQLYLELKAGMASAALEGLPAKAELRKQVFHLWSNWMRWAVSVAARFQDDPERHSGAKPNTNSGLKPNTFKPTPQCCSTGVWAGVLNCSVP